MKDIEKRVCIFGESMSIDSGLSLHIYNKQVVLSSSLFCEKDSYEGQEQLS